MQAGGTVDGFLGAENAMADEGVADLEQSLALGAVLRQPCQAGSDQLLQLLWLVLTHVAADVLGHTVHQPDHLYVHVGSTGPEETSVVRVDELFALLTFEEVEASFVAHVHVSLQTGGGAGFLWVVEVAVSPPVLATRGKVVVFLQSEDQGSQFIVFAGLRNVAGDEPVDEGRCLSLPFGGVQVGSVLHPPQAVDVWGAALLKLDSPEEVNDFANRLSLALHHVIDEAVEAVGEVLSDDHRVATE